MPLGTMISLGASNIVLDADLASPQGAQPPPPNFGPCLLWPNGRSSQLLLSTCKLNKDIDTQSRFFTRAQSRNGCIDSNHFFHINTLGERSDIYETVFELIQGFDTSKGAKFGLSR